MSQPQQQVFSLPGDRQLAATVWRKPNAPVLLALHGWLDNCASFNQLAPQLNATVVAIDLAGHGHSYHRPAYSAYHLWDDLSDVRDILGALGLSEVGLLGHSRGAIVSALFAATYPECVEQLLLIDGLLPEPVQAADAPAQMRKAVDSLGKEAARSFPVYSSVEAAANVRLQGMFPLSPEAALEIAGRGTRPVAGGVSWRVDPKLLAPSMVKLSAQQTDAFANAIKAPTTLVLASEGMPKLFPGFARVLSNLPHIEQHFFEGSHHLHMEAQAADVARLFNQKIAAQVASGKACCVSDVIFQSTAEPV
ncbi:alpha/beta hydrolase [Simiduia sp. 21SJ11W-1]|uniref:alpha/beta hydrolase n=1 Tax=Simiduia sp. 21SJ11W-1 TaxID=2909669 RepID=UPI0020A13AEB|nr:alpha/beta fold hydrolase [Simiduia sp. 21SJ11W-1]UTA46456.1 alpha/beta hydrolase [Simiduia sp. 21SJ11W-1]